MRACRQQSMPACRFRVEIHFHRSWGLGSGKSEIHRIRKESSAPGPPNHCVTATGRSNRQVHAGAHHGAISATTTPSVTATGRCIGSAHNGAEGGNPDRSRHRQSRGNHEATRGHQRPTESRARVDGAINACRCDSCSRSSTYGCLQNSGDLESSLAARAARPRFRQSAPACSPASCRWHEPRRARTCRNQAQSRSRLFEHRAPFLDLMTKLWPSMSQ